MMEMDYTRKFNLQNDKDPEIKEILSSVYQSLQEKGYNPINQIVGYILSEDPTYITNYNNARADPQAGSGRAAPGAGEAVSARLSLMSIQRAPPFRRRAFFCRKRCSCNLQGAGILLTVLTTR